MPTKIHEISIENRAEIIGMQKAGKSIREIGKSYNPPLSYSTVRDILKKKQETGTVQNKPRSGRPSKLNAGIIEKLKISILQNLESRHESLAKITTNLNTNLNINISERTIHQILMKEDIKSHIAMKNLLLMLKMLLKG